MIQKETLNIKVPALKRLSKKKILELYPWAKEIKDTSTEKAGYLNLAMIQNKEDEGYVSGDEVQKRLKASKLKFPGLQHMLWLEEHKDEFPQIKKAMAGDAWWIFFQGTHLRVSRGSWRVPYADWSGARWDRGAVWLDRTWYSRCRVVLLGIESGPIASVSLDPLSIAPEFIEVTQTINGVEYKGTLKKS